MIFDFVLPSFTIISSTNKKDSIKKNATILSIKDSFGFFLNRTQEAKSIGLASHGMAGRCNINTPTHPNIMVNNPEKYSQLPPLVQ